MLKEHIDEDDIVHGNEEWGQRDVRRLVLLHSCKSPAQSTWEGGGTILERSPKWTPEYDHKAMSF